MALVKIFVWFNLVISVYMETVNLQTVLNADVQIGNSLTAAVSGLTNGGCAAGPANATITDICNEMCNCCGCVNSTGCQTYCRTEFALATTPLLRPLLCDLVWPTIGDTGILSQIGFVCSNPAYNGQGNVKLCLLSAECCDGQIHTASETWVPECAASADWYRFCAGCVL